MESWRTHLKVNPVPSLLGSDNEAICYFTRRDLLGEDETPVETLWQMPEAERILKWNVGVVAAKNEARTRPQRMD